MRGSASRPFHTIMAWLPRLVIAGPCDVPRSSDVNRCGDHDDPSYTEWKIRGSVPRPFHTIKAWLPMPATAGPCDVSRSFEVKRPADQLIDAMFRPS